MEENNQKVAGATEKITNTELVEKIEDKKEVIVMNDKTEVAKATVVAGGELRPPMNNVEVVKPEPRVAVAVVNNKSPKDMAKSFLRKAKNDLNVAVNCNRDKDWTPREKEWYRVLEFKTKEINTIIDTIMLVSEQEEEMPGIQKQLEEKPVTDVSVEFGDRGGFVIKNTKTGIAVFQGNEREVKSFLEAMHKMEQAQATKAEDTTKDEQ